MLDQFIYGSLEGPCLSLPKLVEDFDGTSQLFQLIGLGIDAVGGNVFQPAL